MKHPNERVLTFRPLFGNKKEITFAEPPIVWDLAKQPTQGIAG